MDSHVRPIHQSQTLSRREFLGVAASAGAVGAGVVLLGACGSDDGKRSPTTPGTVVDPPPETTTIRLAKTFSLCVAPIYLAEQFLAAEGFTDVQYVADAHGDHGGHQLAAGEIDIGLAMASGLTAAADRGDQLVILAGVHPTCFELFGGDRVQSLRDLKGKRVWIWKDDPTDPHYVFLATLLAYVGIDVEHEIEFVEKKLDDPFLNFDDAMRQMKAGTLDAVLWTPPFPKTQRIENIGHVVLNGLVDPPWSQYFCCMATGNRDFVEKHPAAAKRALRAILKAADVCAREPERAARYLVDNGHTQDYDDALHTITHMSYSAWREFNPEDTVRFFALRLKEAGLVKSTPDELITRATDWRYLNEIKRELGVA
jgi:NitT/TauT family transport system substrate-binding protein